MMSMLEDKVVPGDTIAVGDDKIFPISCQERFVQDLAFPKPVIGLPNMLNLEIGFTLKSIDHPLCFLSRAIISDHDFESAI